MRGRNLLAEAFRDGSDRGYEKREKLRAKTVRTPQYWKPIVDEMNGTTGLDKAVALVKSTEWDEQPTTADWRDVEQFLCELLNHKTPEANSGMVGKAYIQLACRLEGT